MKTHFDSRKRLGKLRRAFVLLAYFSFACASPEPAKEPEEGKEIARPLEFEFVAIDGSRLNSSSYRGRTTIVVFATTYDLNSQGAISLLNAEFRSITPRLNALVVMVEPPKNMELVRTYVGALALDVPVAIADEATFRGEGPLGSLKTVPTFLILDEKGVLREAYSGLPSSAVLRQLVANAR